MDTKSKIAINGGIGTCVLLTIGLLIKIWQSDPMIIITTSALIACVIIIGTILTYTEPLWKSRL